jgi:hypothetical protein
MSNNKLKNRKIFVLCTLFFLLVCSLVFLNTNRVNIATAATVLPNGMTPSGIKALNAILSDDPKAQEAMDRNWLQTKMDDIEFFARDTLWNETIKEGAAAAFWRALSNAANTIAYDTATWIGSGGKGQKPLFVTEDWGTYLTNIGDNAAGTFLEELGQNGAVKFNLCEPSFAVKMQVGLGLTRQVRPAAPACTFRKMVANWEESLDDPKFLENFQDMFKPESNDLGYALSLQTAFTENINKEDDLASKKLIGNGGWLDVRSISGNTVGLPSKDSANYKLEMEAFLQAETLTQTTGTFLDAVNIFLNQLAITLFNRLMGSLNTKDQSITSPYAGDYGGFTNYNADPSSGQTSANDKFRKILEPNFNVRGDYNILAELTACPDPQKAGPTNCVIDEKFRQAIVDRKTVGEAVAEGYLNPNAAFGYLANGLEPNYLEGYPYRSLAILRKFRIIPVGWELAAQKLKKDGRSVTIKQALDCYKGSGDGICVGLTSLIDPNWVLKAPQNYCKKEGPGPEILSLQTVGEGFESSVALLRNDSYCADEQSCIKENDDGSCQYYGYCTEEKRTWQFNADSCEPVYNTCQTFRASDGRTISYLENTLEYCSADGAGCAEYSRNYDYATGKWGAPTAQAPNIFLNSRTESCDSANEGCRELIRTKVVGVNLLKDSSFEAKDQDYWGVDLNFIENYPNPHHGVVVATSSANTVFSTYVDVGKNTEGTQYAFSFWARGCAGASYSFSTDYIAASCIDGMCGQPIDTNDDWQKFKIEYNFKINNPQNRLRIAFQFPNSDCVIDDLQLEEGSTATDYKDYGQAGVVYEKLMPSYMKSYCDIPANADKDECKAAYRKFAQYCEASEVGCELYTSQTDGVAIPAQITAPDYCEATCVGYDTYIQRETVFENSQPAYFIPKTAKICSADAVGCDEFTNLDKVKSGGEAREYYTYLKQCILPDSSYCADFYSWEGDNEAGYQLKTYSLKNDGSAPAITADSYEGKDCTASTYDPLNNPLCREYLNKAGDKFYAFDINTITCSDACRAYRRTEVSDGQNCKSGGSWDSAQGACIYMAIPNEGKQCSAAQAGCRAYSGNKGANYQIIRQWNFDGVDAEGWSGDGVVRGAESIIAGGGSLSVNNGGSSIASVSVSELISDDTSYNLSFLAKQAGGDAGTITGICFNNGVDNACFNQFSGGATSSPIQFGSGWKQFTVNIDLRDYRYIHNISDTENLVITANNSFFIDNIRLTQVIDRYYLIKNSWNTPAECDQDIDGNPYPFYDLGCDYYKDRDDRAHYLHNFTSLCPEASVGCELLIDTYNSNDYQSETTNNITVPADNYIYAVYDRDKECTVEDKGCEMLGKKYTYATSTLYSSVYLRNNPDKYFDILCDRDQVGCKAWGKGGSLVVFKDPGDMVCEWRNGDWYQKKIKRCSLNRDVCLGDSDCPVGQSCQEETIDTPCAGKTAEKTIGYGGAANMVYQPDKDAQNNNWAGLCPANQSGCEEIIDPVSQYSANLLFNPKCSDIDGNSSVCDGWGISGSASQPINLEQNTLYVFDGANTSATVSAGLSNNFKLLNYGNTFNDAVNNIATSSRVLFKTGNDLTSYSLSRPNSAGSEVGVRRAIVEYRIKDDLDRQTCTDENIEKGCVRFDERAINDQNSYKTLNSEFKTPDIIKVLPNRVCDKWLSCRSYVKDENGGNVCFDIGLCQGIDSNGNCSSPIISAGTKQTQTYTGASDISKFANLSGYTKAGWAGVYDKLPNDLYNFGIMSQEGSPASLSNGGFEFYGTNAYPIGWSYEGGVWDSNYFRVMSSPYDIKSDGVCYRVDSSDNCEAYAPEGDGILKLNANYSAESEYVEVNNDSQYIVSALVNTKFLSNGSAVIELTGLQGNPLSLPAGKNWARVVGSYKAVGSQFKIKLKTDVGSVGVIYFDDIQVKPALLVKDDFRMPQSCRLYPEDKSLSCDYYNDSGIREKGWYGYCLEYDRAPGNPDACILWYPIDRVRGDEINEAGAGYQGKYPVYYCLKDDLVYTTQTKNVSPHQNISAVMPIPAEGDVLYYSSVQVGCTYHHPYQNVTITRWLNIPDLSSNYSFYQNLAGRKSENLGIYYNGVTKSFYCTASAGRWDNNYAYADNLRVMWTEVRAYCSKIVETVSSTGQNKAWYSKLNEGYQAGISCNNYVLPNLIASSSKSYTTSCVYGTISSPYGSMSPPQPSNNPYEWDTDDQTNGNQPLYYSDSKYPNMGQLHSTSTLKTLYAKSYSSWIWSNNACASSLKDGEYCTSDADCQLMCVASQNVCKADNFTSTEACDINDPCSSKHFISSCLLPQGQETGAGICGEGCNVGDECKVIDTPDDNYCKSAECRKYCFGAAGAPYGSTLLCNNDNECYAANESTVYCDTTKSWCIGGTRNGEICSQDNDCRSYCGTNNISGVNFGKGICHGGLKDGSFCALDGADCELSNDNDIKCDQQTQICTGGIYNGQSCLTPVESLVASSTLTCSSGDTCRCEPSGNMFQGTNIPCGNVAVGQSSSGTCVQVPGETGYKRDNMEIWNPPVICPGTPPSRGVNDNCAIPPVVDNIKVNGLNTTDAYVIKNGFANLTFTSDVNDDQQPLVMYKVDWGDGESTIVSGVEMRDRPSVDNPHSLYHLYDYWDLKARQTRGVGDITCGTDATGNYCSIKPKIQIKDNWGWCSNGNSTSMCPPDVAGSEYSAFTNNIVIREK